MLVKTHTTRDQQQQTEEKSGKAFELWARLNEKHLECFRFQSCFPGFEIFPGFVPYIYPPNINHFAKGSDCVHNRCAGLSSTWQRDISLAEIASVTRSCANLRWKKPRTDVDHKLFQEECDGGGAAWQGGDGGADGQEGQA